MKSKTKKYLMWGGGIALVLMVLGIVAVPNVPLLPDLVSYVQSLTAGIGGVPVVSAVSVPAVAGQKLLTDSIKLSMVEKYSESPTNANGGNILLYTAGVNPKDPSASVLATLTLGTAYTGADLMCGETYRIVYSNSTSAYAQDLGDVVLIDCATEFNKDTADSFVDLTKKYGVKRQKVATIDDFFDETKTDGRINGQTNSSLVTGTAEIGYTGVDPSADAVMVYNETIGDGTVYLDLTFSASGSQSALKDAVVCFEFESGAEPEGTEISEIVMQHREGSVLNFPSSVDWDTVFANEECVSASSEMLAGTSAKYRMTITYNEANLDTSDDFKLVFDDLGANKGKDAKQNLGATQDYVDFDATV